MKATSTAGLQDFTGSKLSGGALWTGSRCCWVHVDGKTGSVGGFAVNVGSAIRLCRKRRGVSQADVATRAECSVSYLSMLENNKRDPTLSMVTKIADALCVPVGALFVMASEDKDLGAIDSRLTRRLHQAAIASIASASGR